MNVTIDQIVDTIDQFKDSKLDKVNNSYKWQQVLKECAATIHKDTKFCHGSFTPDGGRKVCASAHMAIELTPLKDLLKSNIGRTIVNRQGTKNYYFDFNTTKDGEGYSDEGYITGQLFLNFLKRKHPSLATKANANKLINFIISLNDEVCSTCSDKQRATAIKELLTLTASKLLQQDTLTKE